MRAVYLVIYCFIHHVICGIAKLLQVINFNTICLQNEVLYECIDDQDGILQWDVTQSSSTTSLFTYSYSRLGGTSNYTKRIGSSTISVQLIFKNSTFLSSVLTFTNATSLTDCIIECNGEVESLLDSYMLYTGISGTMYLLNITLIVLISNLNDNTQWIYYIRLLYTKNL